MAYTFDAHVRSVCWGVFVGAGSSDETAQTNGISHLIEHMCFKGTHKRTAFDIVRETDTLGAEINAFTAKENTAYYVHCLDECTEQCVEILSDIVLHHTFDEKELEREKQVVLEEIDMSEDAPDDLVGDLASKAFWGKDPLARPILGSKKNVMRFTSEDLFAYEHRLYVAQNVVLSVVGHIDEAEAIRLGETYFTFPSGRVKKAPRAVLHTPTQCAKKKDVEQSNIVLAFAGLPRYDERTAALSVFDAVFGGGMSSVLFQRVREQLGLAYSVYGYPSAYVGRGAYSIYLGTNPAKVDQALSTVRSLIDEIKQKGIDDAQLCLGKQMSKSTYVLGLESNLARMRVQARWLLGKGVAFDENEQIAKLDNVTKQDVKEIIDTVFAAPPSIGLVAKQTQDLTGYFYGW